jgi:tetratricopeptide (TPR) repeat protein
MKFRGWILIAALVMVGGLAKAEGEQNTQDLLIDQLERVYKNLAPSDASKIPVTLRLADLYSERARLAAMKDLDSGCTTCTAGEADRTKALRLYQEALPKMPDSGRGRVMIQVGHLYELTGRQKEAISYYETILQKPDTGGAADAQLSLAEIYFKKNQYADASKYYAKVLADTRASSRGLAAYRLAWCELNLGHFADGLAQLKQILTTHDLQSKSGMADGQADHQFVEEVSRDLATWMAREPVAQAQID